VNSDTDSDADATSKMMDHRKLKVSGIIFAFSFFSVENFDDSKISIRSNPHKASIKKFEANSRMASEIICKNH
jgi:hypothetical protein